MATGAYVSHHLPSVYKVFPFLFFMGKGLRCHGALANIHHMPRQPTDATERICHRVSSNRFSWVQENSYNHWSGYDAPHKLVAVLALGVLVETFIFIYGPKDIACYNNVKKRAGGMGKGI